MNIILHKDIIELLNNSIGNSLPNNCTRIGRIEYNKYLESESFLFEETVNCDNIGKIEYKQDSKNDCLLKIELDKNFFNYDDFKCSFQDGGSIMINNKRIDSFEKYLFDELELMERKTSISQRFWIKNNKIVASAFCIYSDYWILNDILEKLFYITDNFNEPNYEDTKTIEWNLLNKIKTIIVLPKKYVLVKNSYRFTIISGEMDFMGKNDVWKTNL